MTQLLVFAVIAMFVGGNGPGDRIVGTWRVVPEDHGTTRLMRISIDKDSLRLFSEDVYGNFVPHSNWPAQPTETGPKGMSFVRVENEVDGKDTTHSRKSFTVSQLTKNKFRGYFFSLSYVVGQPLTTSTGGGGATFTRVK